MAEHEKNRQQNSNPKVEPAANDLAVPSLSLRSRLIGTALVCSSAQRGLTERLMKELGNLEIEFDDKFSTQWPGVIFGLEVVRGQDKSIRVEIGLKLLDPDPAPVAAGIEVTLTDINTGEVRITHTNIFGEAVFRDVSNSRFKVAVAPSEITADSWQTWTTLFRDTDSDLLGFSTTMHELPDLYDRETGDMLGLDRIGESEYLMTMSCMNPLSEIVNGEECADDGERPGTLLFRGSLLERCLFETPDVYTALGFELFDGDRFRALVLSKAGPTAIAQEKWCNLASSLIRAGAVARFLENIETEFEGHIWSMRVQSLSAAETEDLACYLQINLARHLTDNQEEWDEIGSVAGLGLDYPVASHKGKLLTSSQAKEIDRRGRLT